MKLRPLVTILVVLLLLTSVTAPVAADPAPLLAVAAPPVATLVIEGVEVMLASTVIIGIGAELGKHWDGITGNWDKFASDVGKAIDGLIARAEWVDATSNESKVLIQAEKELYDTAAATGGKKPGEDEWYHEAKLEDRKVKINTERLTEEQAVAKVKDGKDIFTLKQDLAEGVAHRSTREVAEAKGLPEEKIERLLEKIGKLPEKHCDGKPGYYPHYHPQGIRDHLHIWYSP